MQATSVCFTGWTQWLHSTWGWRGGGSAAIWRGPSQPCSPLVHTPLHLQEKVSSLGNSQGHVLCSRVTKVLQDQRAPLAPRETLEIKETA